MTPAEKRVIEYARRLIDALEDTHLLDCKTLDLPAKCPVCRGSGVYKDAEVCSTTVAIYLPGGDEVDGTLVKGDIDVKCICDGAGHLDDVTVYLEDLLGDAEPIVHELAMSFVMLDLERLNPAPQNVLRSTAELNGILVEGGGRKVEPSDLHVDEAKPRRRKRSEVP